MNNEKNFEESKKRMTAQLESLLTEQLEIISSINRQVNDLNIRDDLRRVMLPILSEDETREHVLGIIDCLLRANDPEDINKETYRRHGCLMSAVEQNRRISSALSWESKSEDYALIQRALENISSSNERRVADAFSSFRVGYMEYSDNSEERLKSLLLEIINS